MGVSSSGRMGTTKGVLRATIVHKPCLRHPMICTVQRERYFSGENFVTVRTSVHNSNVPFQ